MNCWPYRVCVRANVNDAAWSFGKTKTVAVRLYSTDKSGMQLKEIISSHKTGPLSKRVTADVHFIIVSSNLLFLRALVVIVEYISMILANPVETKAAADIGMSLLVCQCCPCRVAEDLVHFFQSKPFSLGNLDIAYG